ncbi:MAG TPA: malto-oligosyltrehalose trehalohydrolase [Steroidobacteraceae bacterium]|nr:malto-oligosyltrehalose trehalohydrolase [Steroidobacteraceae bacterium]
MLGARLAGTRCEFRTWAPQARQVHVELYGEGTRRAALLAAGEGYFTATVEGVRAGQTYRYLLDGKALPDPCSRFQPDGPHGPSGIVDAAAYRWHDAGWPGVGLEGLVLYELHVGTFTTAGTFAAAIERLGHLRALGVTVIEIMPLAECPGRFNWGYDGVFWFAPSHNYGPYEAFKSFVDAAHATGLGVILDVVYNHLGPDGNYLRSFSPHYMTARATEWGDAINYDGEHCGPVRELVVENACEWVREFHLDGLRLDATQSIFDTSRRHVLAELAAAARAAASPRRILVIAENESQRATYLLPEAQGGLGLDAIWNDDFHHAAMVAATGHRGAYYNDYLGTPQEFLATARHGFLYQGQYYRWQQQPRGEPQQVPSRHCVAYLQNHDQVANSLHGLRLHQLAAGGVRRALTALLLLGPQTPLLFMGQEFEASAPFLFFADHHDPLRTQVHAGRRQFMAQFPGAASADGRAAVCDPGAQEPFLRSKLDWNECREDSPAVRLHRDLLRLRREDPVLHAQGREGFDGAVLTGGALLLRWFAAAGDRLLVVNLGTEISERPMPEPLLAPPRGCAWSLLWSSEHAAYGGDGTSYQDPASGWRLPGQCAMLLAARPVEGGA